MLVLGLIAWGIRFEMLQSRYYTCVIYALVPSPNRCRARTWSTSLEHLQRLADCRGFRWRLKRIVVKYQLAGITRVLERRGPSRLPFVIRGQVQVVMVVSAIQGNLHSLHTSFLAIALTGIFDYSSPGLLDVRTMNLRLQGLAPALCLSFTIRTFRPM